MIKRRRDWSAKLVACMTVAKTLPFKWGQHDCCMFAAWCVDSMCDSKFVDAIKERFNYSDANAAAVAVSAGGGLGPLISEFLGQPMDNHMFAQPGDLALVRDSLDRELLCIGVGHQFVTAAEIGLGCFTLDNVVAAWRV